MKYKPNFASEWLAYLILFWNHQFQISGCKVAVLTDCFVVLHSLSSKILRVTQTQATIISFYILSNSAFTNNRFI